MSDLEKKSPNELAEIRTTLAVERTLMAADRTLLAWVRTTLFMISFGFTIYKILQGFQSGATAVIVDQAMPRAIGLFLISMGIWQVSWESLNTGSRSNRSARYRQASLRSGCHLS